MSLLLQVGKISRVYSIQVEHLRGVRGTDTISVSSADLEVVTL